MARLAMTSLALMLVWVPLPVCHTLSGNWSARPPPITSSAARTISRTFSAGSRPSSPLTRAATFLTSASA